MRICLAGRDAQAWNDDSIDSLGKVIAEKGYDLVDHVSASSDVVVFLNWDKSSKKILVRAKYIGATCVLSITEPTPVIPSHGNQRLRSQFDGIVEFGRAHASPRVCLPSAWEPGYFSNSNRHDKVVAVSGNKFSFILGELYSLRLRAYSRIEDIDVFGSGWQATWLEDLVAILKELIVSITSGARLSPACAVRLMPHMRFKCDPVPDKLRKMSEYRYCLVIENSEEYVSEKLIDGILAGALPVYVGGLPNHFGVPEDLYVKSGPSMKEIEAALIKARAMDYEAWRRKAKVWIDNGYNHDIRSRASANKAILAAIEEAIVSKSKEA